MRVILAIIGFVVSIGALYRASKNTIKMMRRMKKNDT